jgi:hypothetical protein
VRRPRATSRVGDRIETVDLARRPRNSERRHAEDLADFRNMPRDGADPEDDNRAATEHTWINAAPDMGGLIAYQLRHPARQRQHVQSGHFGHLGTVDSARIGEDDAAARQYRGEMIGAGDEALKPSQLIRLFETLRIKGLAIGEDGVGLAHSVERLRAFKLGHAGECHLRDWAASRDE